MRAYNIERREATHLLQERYNETVKILQAVREAATVQHDSISSLSSSSSEEDQVEEGPKDEAAELLQEQELSTTEEEAESEEDSLEEIQEQLEIINGKLCNFKMLTLSRLTISFNFSLASLTGGETRRGRRADCPGCAEGRAGGGGPQPKRCPTEKSRAG